MNALDAARAALAHLDSDESRFFHASAMRSGKVLTESEFQILANEIEPDPALRARRIAYAEREASSFPIDLVMEYADRLVDQLAKGVIPEPEVVSSTVSRIFSTMQPSAQTIARLVNESGIEYEQAFGNMDINVRLGRISQETVEEAKRILVPDSADRERIGQSVHRVLDSMTPEIMSLVADISDQIMRGSRS